MIKAERSLRAFALLHEYERGLGLGMFGGAGHVSEFPKLQSAGAATVAFPSCLRSKQAQLLVRQSDSLAKASSNPEGAQDVRRLCKKLGPKPSDEVCLGGEIHCTWNYVALQGWLPRPLLPCIPS
jgi:hypothetical protein